MKRNKIALILSSFALALSVGTFIGVSNTNKEPAVTFATYTNGDGATYYNSIDDTQSGNTLLTSLRSLNLSRRKSTVGYSAMGTSTDGQFKYTDYDPNYVKYDSNGQPYGTKILSFYTFTSATSWNREHVWPNSHGGGSKGDAGSPYPDADIHMPRPTISSENSSRGNSFFVEGMNHSSSGWDPYTAGYSAESRGEAARITFYCTLVNSKLILAPNNTTPGGTDSVTGQSFGSGHTMGNLETLLKWNIDYPINDREKRRNEGAEYLQGNRNPFIDHPEYACKIWGNVNSTTKSLCANATYPTVGHTAGIRVDDGYEIASTNSTAYTLKVGDTVNFLPFVDGAYNASVSWTLSDYSVTSSTYYSRGSYTNGVTIEGLTAGVSTLTLTYSYDDNGTAKTAVAQVLITVNTSGSSGGGEGGGDAEGVDNIKNATYTVTAVDSVSESGVPSESSASYSQNYSTKGQLTSNKTATLTLSGYDGKVITGITLNMHSNGSSGGGSFTAVAGATNLAYTSGSFNTWYDNDSYGTSWRNINVSMINDTHIIGTGEDVTLTITASANSLYINSYTVTYGDPSSGGGEEEVVLTSIAASGMTQAYQTGDVFSFDGILKATYSDGNVETVIPDSVTSPDMSTAGNKTITLTYSDGGVTKTTTYQISVVQKQLVLSSITLSGMTTSYYVGDTFAFDGTVTAHYEDSSVTKTVTPTAVSAPEMYTPGNNKTVTVTYTENGVSKSAQYTINVQAIELTDLELGGLTTEYYVGDTLVKPTVTAHYNDGSSYVVTDQATFTGFDSSEPCISQEITVTYGELSEVYCVSITAKPTPEPGSGDYVKVTSTADVTPGDYLIVYESASKAFDGSLSTLDAARNTIDVTITSGKIASSSTVNASKFTLASYSGGFSICSSSGKYINRTVNSNGMEVTTDPAKNTITIDGSGNASIVGSGGASLRYNANSADQRFRYYKDAGQQAIQLYKCDGTAGPTEDAVLESITISNATTAYAQGATFVKPTVTAHYDDESSKEVTTASFSGYNMQQVGNQIVTAHYTENGVTVTASYNITVSMNTTVTTPLSSFHDGTITLKTDRGDLTNSDWYDIEGIVVGINGYQYYIQQGDYGVLVYNEVRNNTEYLYTYYNGISLGDHVLIHARIYAYKGLVETNARDSGQTVSKLGNSPLPDAAEYSSISAFNAAHQSIRASLSNVAVDDTNITNIASFSGSSTDDQSFLAYDINNKANKVTVFIHKSINTNAKTAIVNKLQTITEEDTVEFLRCVVAYHDGSNQISLSSADQIVIHSPSEDKLEAWGVNYLFIGDPAFDGNGTGACKSANLYKDAKTALLALESEEPGVIETLQSDSTYSAELARYLAWAAACGDTSPFVNDFTFMNNARINQLFDISNGNTIIVVAIISSLVTLSFLGIVVMKKKRRFHQ